MTPRQKTSNGPAADESGSVASEAADSGTQAIKEMLFPTMERLEKIRKGELTSDTIATGYRDLDSLTSGFQPGEVVVVAGRPSMGKTAFALNIAANGALDGAVPTQLFMLETTKEATVNRLLTAEGRVDAMRLRKGTLRDEEFLRLANAAGTMMHAPMYIDELHSRHFEDLLNAIRETHRNHGTRLVVIDYLQLLEGPMPRAENRTQELSAMSRALKGIAKELRLVIIVLSQCSRAPEQRVGADRRPRLTDIRDSGSIEEDADVVILLYRPELYEGPVDYDGNSIEGRAEIIVGKRRGGPWGIVDLFFNKTFTRFESYVKT